MEKLRSIVITNCACPPLFLPFCPRLFISLLHVRVFCHNVVWNANRNLRFSILEHCKVLRSINSCKEKFHDCMQLTLTSDLAVDDVCTVLESHEAHGQRCSPHHGRQYQLVAVGEPASRPRTRHHRYSSDRSHNHICTCI